MTRETLELLRQLLDNQQLRIGDPEFADLSQKALKAQEELGLALGAMEEG